MVPIGPGAKTKLLIVFKPGTTPSQSEEFVQKVFQLPRPDGSHNLRAGISMFWATNIHGRYGYAVDFGRSASIEQIGSISLAAKNSPLVCKIFESRSANEITIADIASCAP